VPEDAGIAAVPLGGTTLEVGRMILGCASIGGWLAR
jgi:hypothetical protein